MKIEDIQSLDDIGFIDELVEKHVLLDIHDRVKMGRQCPSYSMNCHAAVNLLHVLKRRGWMFSLSMTNDGWVAKVDQDGKEIAFANDPSFCMAICKAALIAAIKGMEP